MLLRLTIYSPIGIEYLMPTMLGISLSKHHQLDIIGITAQFAELLKQVVDLVFCQSQTKRAVRSTER